MLSLEIIGKYLGENLADYSELELEVARHDLTEFAQFACEYYYQKNKTNKH